MGRTAELAARSCGRERKLGRGTSLRSRDRSRRLQRLGRERVLFLSFRRPLESFRRRVSPCGAIERLSADCGISKKVPPMATLNLFKTA